MDQYANVQLPALSFRMVNWHIGILTHWHIIQLIHYLDSNLKRKLYLCTPKEN